MSASCRCGATWVGVKLEHCTVCHRSFTSTLAGDMHRTGKHHISSGPDRRRCRTVEEMERRGLTARTLPNGHVVWGQPGRNPLRAMQGDGLESPDSPTVG